VKYTLAISLLLLHLFNMGGYQLLFNHFENQSSSRLMAKIDQQAYDDQHLIEIKVPIELPYNQNWTDYERVDGEIVLEGVHYNYVKRKLVNDTMILLCIPNTEKTQIHNARETFFSLVNDLQQESSKESPASKSPESKTIKFTISDFDQDVNSLEIAVINFNAVLQGIDASSNLLMGHLTALDKPPAFAV
jgi:hypothetical protein